MLANSVDPDQTPHSAASDLGLHCLGPQRRYSISVSIVIRCEIFATSLIPVKCLFYLEPGA